jgi:hypothetical protein
MPRNATTTRHQPTARRWQRAVLWVVFAVTLVSGMQLSGQSFYTDPSVLDRAGAATMTTVGDQPAVAGTVTGATGAPAGGPVFVAASDGSQTRLIKANSGDNGDPLDLLPAWRWRGAEEMLDTYGWRQIGEKGLSGIAGILFALSSLLWMLILGTLRLALGFDLARHLGGSDGRALSRIFASIGDSLIASGLVFVVILAGLFYAITASLKGRLTNVVSLIVAAVVPLAALFALTAAANKDAIQSGSAAPVVGSPVYLADRGLRLVDTVAGSVGSALGSVRSSSVTQTTPYSQLAPSCTAYKEALVRAFRASQSSSSSVVQGGQGKLTAEDRSGIATESLAAVSSLWEGGFLANWAVAQYHASQPGARIWCHQLEASAGTPRAEQVEIGMLAGYPSLDIDAGQLEGVRDATGGDLSDDMSDTDMSNEVDGGAFSPGNQRLGADGRPQSIQAKHSYYVDRLGRRDPYLATSVSGQEKQAALLVWAACVYDGVEWKAQAAWYRSGSMNGDHCEEWYYLGIAPGQPTGGDQPLLQWGSRPDGSGTVAGIDFTSSSNKIGDKDPVRILNYERGVHDDVSDVSDVVYGMSGDNASRRAVAGFITLLTAVVFMYVLGGIAIGALVAKLGFVIMLTLLPVTLFLLALPTGTKKRHPAGLRLLKMTGGYMAANFVLTGFVVLLLAVINVVSALTVSALPVGGGATGIATMAVPLIALWVLRKALKAVGMGDAGTVRGALGMSASAAAGASGGMKEMKSRQSRLDKELADPANQGLGARMRRKLDTKGAGVWGDKAGAWTKDRTVGAAKNVKNRAGELRGKVGDAVAQTSIGQSWSEKMTGPGRLKDRLASAAGVGAMLERATEGRGDTAAAAGKLAGTLGRKVTSFNPARMDKADAVEAAAQHKREMARSLAGLSGPEREQAKRDFYTAKNAELAGAVQFDTLGDGTVLPSGEKVYGFSITGPDGTRQFITPALAGYDPLTGTTATPGVTMHTDPILDFSSAERGAVQMAAAAKLGVDQARVGVSTNGTTSVFLPDLGAKNPVASFAGRPDDLLHVANQGSIFIPPEVMARVDQLDSAAKADFVQSYMVAAGALDPATGASGALALLGYDTTRPETLAALSELADGKGPLAGAQLHVASSTVAALVSSAFASSHELRQGSAQARAVAEVDKVIETNAGKVKGHVTFVSKVHGDAVQAVALGEQLEKSSSAVRAIDGQLTQINVRAAQIEQEIDLGASPQRLQELRVEATALRDEQTVLGVQRATVEAQAADVARQFDTVFARVTQPAVIDALSQASADTLIIAPLRKLKDEVSAGNVAAGVSQIEALAFAQASVPDIAEVVAQVAASSADPAAKARELATLLEQQLVAPMNDVAQTLPSYYTNKGKKTRRASSLNEAGSNPLPTN